jgi:hypothetical protein
MDRCLCLHPGSSVFLQFLTPAAEPFLIPAGSTIAATVVDILRTKVCDLALAIADQTVSRGFVNVTLPDNALVRSYFFRRCFYDIQITLPTGVFKYECLKELHIKYSPTQIQKNDLPGAAPTLYVPGNTTPPTNPTTPAPTPGVAAQTLFIEYQGWISNTGKKYEYSIETIAGVPTPKFTEIL